MSDESTAGIRLNKHISDTGICSRREADEFIEQGRVTVNGQVADNGVQVQPGDEVMVDGKRPARQATSGLPGVQQAGGHYLHHRPVGAGQYY